VFGFYIVHQIIYLVVARGMVGQDLAWRWGHMAFAGFANAALAVPLFMILDYFKQRG